MRKEVNFSGSGIYLFFCKVVDEHGGSGWWELDGRNSSESHTDLDKTRMLNPIVSSRDLFVGWFCCFPWMITLGVPTVVMWPSDRCVRASWHYSLALNSHTAAVNTDSGGPLSFMAFRVHMREVLAVIRHTSHPRYLDSAQNRNFRKNM